MKKNVGTLDGVIRVVLGIFLLSMLFWINGPVKYGGLLGFLPLLTAFVSFCPLYVLLKISTLPKPEEMESKEEEKAG